MITWTKDTNRLQVTTKDSIFFYLIDEDSYELVVENVMNNYMTCSYMLIDQSDLYAVAYKTNQKSFDIFSKKYMNDFRVQSIDKNFEGCKAIEVESVGLILASFEDELLWIETKTYQSVGHIHIPIPPS